MPCGWLAEADYSKVPNKRAGEINVQAGFFHNFNKRAGSNTCAVWIFSEQLINVQGYNKCAGKNNRKIQGVKNKNEYNNSHQIEGESKLSRLSF